MIFAKVAANLDTHPKIRKAGRDGREVFLFVLRKNAELDLGGVVPSLHVEPWYLAEQLMMTESEASNGLSRCVTAGLLAIDGHAYSVLGWDEQWSRRPLTNAERQAKYRARTPTSNSGVTKVTDSNGPNRDDSLCNVLDQSRSEKKEESRPPAEAIACADQLRGLVLEAQPTNALRNKPWTDGGTRFAWARELQTMARVDGRPWNEVTRMLEWVFYGQHGDARFVVESPSSLRRKWDRIALAMNRPATQQTRQQEIRDIPSL